MSVKQPSVLVVEDDRDVLNVITQVLESEDYRVYKAENGSDALRQIVDWPINELPSCIVLDLMMPVMDGATFLQNLIQDYAGDWAKVPIIVATAVASSNPILQALPLPVDILRKPIELEDLLAAVGRYRKALL